MSKTKNNLKDMCRKKYEKFRFAAQNEYRRTIKVDDH